jgi:hypothetical protein
MELAGVPTQSAPIDRSKLLQTFMVGYPVGEIAAGKTELLRVVSGPEPNDKAHFSRWVNPSLGICRMLSSYAVGPCFRTGGLF